MPNLKVVVGLGNPGKKYLKTRHNVGFRVIDRLAVQYKVKLKKSVRLKACLGELKLGLDSFLLVKPKTYMNNSGYSVVRILAKYKASVKDLLVIYDDADLDLGCIRIRKRGSSAGHRGLASLIEALGAKQINRMKIGIGRLGSGDLADYVLSNFSSQEKKIADKVVSEAAKISLEWFGDSEEKTIQV